MPASLSLRWQPEDVTPVLVLLTATLAYLLYHYAAQAPGFERRLRARGLAEDRARTGAVLAQRVVGAVLLGALPAALAWLALGAAPSELGLRPGVVGRSAAVLVVGIPVAVLVTRRAAARPAMLLRYPQIRAPRWSKRLVLGNAVAWAIYLAGYEIFFRGFLLVPLAHAIGTWPAIAATSALYVAVHLDRDLSEAAGTVVAGPLFAVIALWTQSLAAPFLLHLAVALSNDTFARRARAAGAQE